MHNMKLMLNEQAHSEKYKFKLTPSMQRTMKESMAAIKKLRKNSFESHAYGCILGAFAGDSIGSYLEFYTRPANQEQIQDCMDMYGGGVHQVGSGQVTDDSEMAWSLMLGILDSNPSRANYAQ